MINSSRPFTVTPCYSLKAVSQLDNLGGQTWLKLVNSIKGYGHTGLYAWERVYNSRVKYKMLYTPEKAELYTKGKVGFKYSQNLYLVINDALALMDKHESDPRGIDIYAPEIAHHYGNIRLCQVFDDDNLIKWAFDISISETGEDRVYNINNPKLFKKPEYKSSLIAYFTPCTEL